jgi:hypothetical protein
MEDGEVEVTRMEARMLRIEHELLELDAEIRGKEAAAQGAEGEAQVAGCQEGWRNAKERMRVPAYATRGGEGSRKSSTRSVRAKDVLEEREQQMHHWQNEGVSANRRMLQSGHLHILVRLLRGRSQPSHLPRPLPPSPNRCQLLPPLRHCQPSLRLRPHRSSPRR